MVLAKWKDFVVQHKNKGQDKDKDKDKGQIKGQYQDLDQAWNPALLGGKCHGKKTRMTGTIDVKNARLHLLINHNYNHNHNHKHSHNHHYRHHYKRNRRRNLNYCKTDPSMFFLWMIAKQMVLSEEMCMIVRWVTMYMVHQGERWGIWARLEQEVRARLVNTQGVGLVNTQGVGLLVWMVVMKVLVGIAMVAILVCLV